MRTVAGSSPQLPSGLDRAPRPSARRVTSAFSPQWCSSTQPRWDSPRTRSTRRAGWSWPSARRVVGRMGSLRASEATAVCGLRTRDGGPGEASAGAGSPRPGAGQRHRRRWAGTAAGVKPHPLGTSGQRTQSGSPPGAPDMAGGDTPAWGPTILQLTWPGHWWTGGDPWASPAGQGMGRMRLSPKEAVQQ